MARRPWTVIPIDPRSGTPWNPRPQQLTFYSLVSPTGKTRKLLAAHVDHPDYQGPVPQPHSARTLRWLNSLVASQRWTFVVPQELTGRPLRIGRKALLREDGTPYRRPRLAPPSRGRQQQILYVRGRRIRPLDIGYQPPDRRVSIPRGATPLLAKLEGGKWTTWQFTGRTIKDSLQQVVVALPLDAFKRGDYRIQWMIRISRLGEETIVLPGRTGVIGEGDRITTLRDGEKRGFVEVARQWARQQGGPLKVYSHDVAVLANLYTELSRSIRTAIGQFGLTYTSLADLQEFIGKQLEEQEEDDDDYIVGTPAFATGFVPVTTPHPPTDTEITTVGTRQYFLWEDLHELDPKEDRVEIMLRLVKMRRRKWVR